MLVGSITRRGYEAAANSARRRPPADRDWLGSEELATGLAILRDKAPSQRSQSVGQIQVEREGKGRAGRVDGREDLTKLDFLVAKSELCESLTVKARSVICKAMALRGLKSYETLFQQGDVADACYIVLSGLVGVYVGKPSEVCVSTLGPLSAVGEWSLLGHDKRRSAGGAGFGRLRGEQVGYDTRASSYSSYPSGQVGGRGKPNPYMAKG